MYRVTGSQKQLHAQQQYSDMVSLTAAIYQRYRFIRRCSSTCDIIASNLVGVYHVMTHHVTLLYRILPGKLLLHSSTGIYRMIGDTRYLTRWTDFEE